MRLSVKVNQQGIAIVWLVVIMVVVSTVGVAMLRLYSTSTAGWVDTNTTNEAKMLADSGFRFFSSEYRSQTNDRKKNELVEELNDKTFKVATEGEGQFKLDVTSHFYRVTTSKKLSELKFVGAPGFSVPGSGFLKLDGDDTFYRYTSRNYNSNTGICTFTISGAAPSPPPEAYTTVRPVVQANINAVSEGGTLTLGSLSSGSAEVFPPENGMIMIEKQEILESLPAKTTIPYRYEYRNGNQLVNIQKGPSQRYFTDIEASSSASVELGKFLTLESTGSFGDLASKTQTYRLSLDHARFSSGLKSYWSFDNLDFGQDTYGWGGGDPGGLLAQPSQVGGMVGSALKLSSRILGLFHDYIVTEFNPRVSIGSGRPFTIVFWAKPETVPLDDKARTVIGAADLSSSPKKQFGIYTLNRKWVWSLGDKDGMMFESTNPDPLPAATTDWQHVAYVYNGNDIFLYKNGIKEYEHFGFGSIAQLPDLSVAIGASSTTGGAGSYFTGLIDEMAIFDRALTFCEINAIFHVPTTVPCNIGCDAMVYYPFNGDTKDQSGSNWDGGSTPYPATARGATPTQDRCGKDNKAYSFNGSNSYLDTQIILSTVISAYQPFMVAFWVKPEETNGEQTIIGARPSGQQVTSSFYIQIYNGKWRFAYGSNQIDTQIPVTKNVWSHIGFVYDYSPYTQSETVSFYLNGGEKSYSYPSRYYLGQLPYLNIYIGARNRGSNRDTYFKGTIDEVLIKKKVSSEDEMEKLIKKLYKRTKP